MKNSLGEYYDDSADFQKQQFDRLLHYMGEAMDVDAIHYLLDIGAGTGARTYSLPNVWPNIERIDAIEPDWEMLSVARQKYAHDKIHYHAASAESLTGVTHDLGVKYDTVFMNWVVHWIKGKEKLLSDLKDVTKSNAFFAFSTCQKLPDVLMDVDHYIRQELKLPSTVEYPWYYLNQVEWDRTLKINGWKVIKNEAVSVNHYVDDARKYLEHWFAASTSKFLYGHQMEELSDLALSDLAFYLERKYPHPDKDGGLYFTEDALFVIAQKA